MEFLQPIHTERGQREQKEREQRINDYTTQLPNRFRGLQLPSFMRELGLETRNTTNRQLAEELVKDGFT